MTPDKPLKILIGGGAGYIGSALVPVLLDHGYEVDVMDLLWFGNNLPKEVNVMQRDLMDCTAKDFEGYDIFIFLAGLSNDPMAEYSPVANFIYNGALPSFLAYEAKKAGIKKFIYASSCSVYGYTVDELYDENAPATCEYPYGIGKLQGEKGVLQLQDENFSTIALRQGTVSGFSPRMRMDLVVNAMFKSAMTNKCITANNASIWRPILSINDAITAYLRSIQANPSISGIFNVSSGNYTVGQIGDIVKDNTEKLTGQHIDMEIKSIEDFRNYKVKTDKARTYLGFQPRHSVDSIVDDLYKNLDSFGNFENENFYNIKVFQKLQLGNLDIESISAERRNQGLKKPHLEESSTTFQEDKPTVN